MGRGSNLDGGDHLWGVVVVEDDEDDGHSLRNEGKGAMLEGATRIALSVDVGDLLDLEGPLEGNRHGGPLAKHEHVLNLAGHEGLGNGLDLLVGTGAQAHADARRETMQRLRET